MWQKINAKINIPQDRADLIPELYSLVILMIHTHSFIRNGTRLTCHNIKLTIIVWVIFVFNNYYILHEIELFTCDPFQFFVLDVFFGAVFFVAFDVAICCWVWCIICWIISNCCLVKLSSLSAPFRVSIWPLCRQKYRIMSIKQYVLIPLLLLLF